MRSLLSRCILPLASIAVVLGAGLRATEMPAIGRGPHAVGSTNMEITVDPARPLIDALKGTGSTRGGYISDLLAHPEAALVAPVEVPADRARYGRNAGVRLPVLLYVLYPTIAENPRADYPFPYPDTADNVFPHMQRAGEKPLVAAQPAKHPLIIFSHGFEGHGLWDLDHLKFLAAHGYIVASVFHGDGRFGFERGLAMRPLMLRRALDFLLEHPDFGPAIDRERIGASGASFGGYTVLATLGGRDPDSAPTDGDSRIKAGVGLVPFMGATFGFWPFRVQAWPFGEDYAGLRFVRAPFLALYGENDANVPAVGVRAGIDQLAGPAQAVLLRGEQHLLSKNAWSDVHTWELRFFDAWLRGDEQARQLLREANSVAGGVSDQKTHQRPSEAASPGSSLH